jgi:hypothetical protein
MPTEALPLHRRLPCQPAAASAPHEHLQPRQLCHSKSMFAMENRRDGAGYRACAATTTKTCELRNPRRNPLVRL